MEVKKKYEIYADANKYSTMLFTSVINDEFTITEALEIGAKIPLFLLMKSLPEEDVKKALDGSANLTAEISQRIIEEFQEKGLSVPELCCIASGLLDYLMSTINK